ncbi:MAG: hypothetical protein KAR80_05800, partial [Rhodospirillaceae bacterium]|nr:hypothetical protein [Rhodospirillaceae bacterium]
YGTHRTGLGCQAGNTGIKRTVKAHFLSPKNVSGASADLSGPAFLRGCGGLSAFAMIKISVHFFVCCALLLQGAGLVIVLLSICHRG